MNALDRLWRRINKQWAAATFPGSATYWETRYRRGGTSGPGSSGRLAIHKALTVNRVARALDVRSVIELGCGDGAQAELLQVARYHGVDVSPAAVRRCRRRFADDSTRTFSVVGEPMPFQRADMSLSMDVIIHLVEDEVFDDHMRQLFTVSRGLVGIYSTDFDQRGWPHVRHRHFSKWVERERPSWRLVESVEAPFPFDPEQPEETSDALFHVYARIS